VFMVLHRIRLWWSTSRRNAGPEEASLMQELLAFMKEYECFPTELELPTLHGQSTVRVDIEWHLCADYALMAQWGGYCSCSSTFPCLYCLWRRGDNAAAAPLREFKDVRQMASWAERYFKTLHQCVTKVRMPHSATRIVGRL
jgi:hypothetical protein